MIIRPTTGRVSSPFGWRWNYTDHHEAIDFSGPVGTPVYAAHAGTVVNVWPNGAMSKYGRAIVIKHDLPADAPYSLYAHLSAEFVKKGQRVSAGQRIASIGTTAASSTDPARKVPAHLHFELVSKWPPAGPGQDRIDPTPYIAGLEVPSAKTGFGLVTVGALLGVLWWLRRRR